MCQKPSTSVDAKRKMSEIKDDVGKALKTFGATDYAVFASMLAVCSGIGLYFGYKDLTSKKRKRLVEGSEAFNFLLGGQNIHIFPGSTFETDLCYCVKYLIELISAAMTLVSSFVTGITILGTSTEIFLYGMQYAYILVGAPFIMGIFLHFVIIPVFYDLQFISMFEVIVDVNKLRDTSLI